MASPLAEYHRPMRLASNDAAGHRPASAHGAHGAHAETGGPARPKSVPPSSKLRREVQKSRQTAYYSLDDSEEVFQKVPPPVAGRDPTLEEKSEAAAGAEPEVAPRWVTTRNRGGIVRHRLSRSYAMHVAGRLAGRDVDSGFRSPAGTDYVPVGGAVSAMSGQNIRNKIAGGWQSSMRKNTAVKRPAKTLLHLEHTHELKVDSYKFNYFLFDLSDRPLEHAPKKSLNITLTFLAGSGEAYAAMEGEHEYPTERAHTWKFDIEEAAPSKDESDGADKPKQSATIVITPTDVTYATSRKKRVVLAVRSEQGFLEYKIKAVTQTFLSGTGIANMLGNRDAKKQADRQKAQELKDFKVGISQSYLRTRRAMSGKIPPPRQELSSSALDRLSSAMQSPIATAVAAEDLSSKKTSFVSTLDSALTSWVENPAEFLKTLSAEASSAQANVTVLNAGGGTTQRAGGTTQRAGGATSRSSAMKTGRSMTSARSFSQLSMMSSRSSMKGRVRTSKGVAAQVDEDLQKLDRGEWVKPVLKARVPAAMRLEWALQELEVEKGMRTGDTAMRRYIKTMPRDVRKRDQEQNMSEVLVSSTIQLGSGPIMTPDILQSLYGDDYRAGEFYIVSQQDGRDIPHDQPRVPSLKLEALEDDLAPRGPAAQDRDDSRLHSAREHQPQVESKKESGGQSSAGVAGGGSNSARSNSARGGAGGPQSARAKGQQHRSGGTSARDALGGALSYRSGVSDGPEEGLFSDDDKLAVALYNLNVQQYATKYSKTSEFMDKLAEEQPAAEVGVSLPGMVDLLMDMKIISTSKSSAIGKRDINSIGREIFHERALDHHPSDDEIILSLDEFKIMLERITVLLGKPYYADRVRPKGIDKELWKRLKEDINPTNRLHRISKQENFRRLILKAFGKYNKKADGKLLRDEYVELCKGELGFTKPQSTALLEPAGIYPLFKHIDLHSFARIFIAAEEAVVDVRDTDEARSRSLDIHHMLQNVKTSTSSISSDYLQENAQRIEAFQLQARQASEPESKDIVKTGWLYRQEMSGRAKLWRMYYIVVESHVGGAVLRLFTSPVSQIFHSKAALEAAGQVDELWVDGDDPAQVVILADAQAAREQALEAAAARGQNFDANKYKGSKDQVEGEEDADGWGQCIIKVVCRPKEGAGLGDRKAEYLKVRGCLVEDEAEDWVQAIRQGMQKRQLFSGDTLQEIQPIAKASEMRPLMGQFREEWRSYSLAQEVRLDAPFVVQDLRRACKPEEAADPVESLLVKDVTTILLEALRPSSIIQPTFDREGVISLAKSKQEELDDDDGKGKKKKIKVMETIKEETYSALRAFLTTRRSEAGEPAS